MIDVIVAVYQGIEATRRCLGSVLDSAGREPFEVVVVDDASPDAGVVALVDELAAAGRVALLRNEANEGFVRSVNRGMALHEDRDVVLLNSDTEVANDWLDRLHRCAHGAPDIGTVTPFSNNATICTYPFPAWTAGVPGTLGLAVLDRLFATVNAGRTVDLPTAVGFCMYIRRECLSRVGPFDAERFGRGYGEENDFSLRAASLGWRSVLAGDVFVFHEGAVSFADEREQRMAAASESLLAVHPDYPRIVREFCRRDPPSGLREAVDAARCVAGEPEARAVLAERAVHAAKLAEQMVEAEMHAQAQAAAIAALREALARAEALVRERDEEIPRLRAGLAHAEALAFERQADLERIRASWLWRRMAPLLRKTGSP